MKVSTRFNLFRSVVRDTSSIYTSFIKALFGIIPAVAFTSTIALARETTESQSEECPEQPLLPKGSDPLHTEKVWGIPFDYDWDGRHEEAKKLGVDRRSTRLVREIILIRHGEYIHADSNIDADRRLTERGKSQAFRVGKALQLAFGSHPQLMPLKNRCVHVSGLTRAQETLQQILTFLPRDTIVQENKNLNEGIPCPPNPTLSRLRHVPLSNQKEQAQRIETAFRDLFFRPLRPNDEGIDVVVGHANVFRYFLCRVLQVPPEAWLRFAIGHSSITRITLYSTGHVKVDCVGDVGHLPPEMCTV